VSRSVVRPVESPEIPKKKVEKVISGDAIRQKKPLGKKIKEMFIGGTSQSVGQFILMDIVVPNVKDLLADVVSQGVEKMIFGDTRSASRRTGSRPSGQNGYVNYNRMSNQPPRRDDPRQNISRRARATHDFHEIIIPTRQEAEEVLDNLIEILSKYGQASVSDLYDLCGITPQFTDEKYGWTDLRGADLTRTRNGYLIDLPKPEYISNN